MILRFLPNIRTAKPTDTTGYTWGKPYSLSNIIKTVSNKDGLGIDKNDIIAERWIASDDKKMGSMVITKNGPVLFSDFISQHWDPLLGTKHFEYFGPYLGIVMKLIDTHPDKNKGSLSVQVHPAKNHTTIPSKPEVWLGTGSFYLGFKENISDKEIFTAVADGNLEQHLNLITFDTPQKLCVQGGLVHAIRYKSFLYEWSNSPTIGEIAKGGLADATIGLYDKTDGKIPRPGKEKPELALAVIGHAKLDGITRKVKEDEVISSDHGCIHERLFDFEGLVIEKVILSGEYVFPLSNGTAFYVESGSVQIENEIFEAGEEGFMGVGIGKVVLVSQMCEAVLYLYYRHI